MSGHNRWSKIKRHKAVVGAAKGRLFTKIIKEITVSAKMGGGDVLNHDAEGFEVRCEPAQMHHVAEGLEKAGLKLGEQKWIWIPNTHVHVGADKAKLLLKLMEILEENDDVQNVFANFEMDE